MNMLKARFRLLLLLLMAPVMAQATTVGLSTIMSTFQTTTQGWYHAIFTDALGLFGALFGIEITWLAVTWMIGGKDVHDIFSSFIKKLLTIGFFYTVLESSSQWVPWIIGGFKTVAINAGGVPVTTVGDLVMTGVQGFITCIGAGPAVATNAAGSTLSDLWNLNFSGALSSAGTLASAVIGITSGLDFIVGLIVGFILLMSFVYVVLELVAVQLEGMIVLSMGVIMLGFGGARWTARFVESYMQYAVAVGVRLMVITLWASFIEWQVNPLIKTTLINGNASLESYAIVIVLALLVAWLTKKLPGFANSILSGQSTLSGGELYDAVKKGSIAAAAVVTGGAALAAGAAGAGAMGAAEGAAGSSGAGSLSASQSGGAAASSEAGGMQASQGVQPPAPQPEAKSSAVLPPDFAGPAPAGVQPPSAGQSAPSISQAAASGGQTAPSGGQAESSNGQAPASSGGQAPSDPVDHRAAAPNSASSGGDQTPASGVQAPASGGSSSSGDGKASPAPSALDQAKVVMQNTHEVLHGAHDALTPGKPSSGGVSAPNLGVKHLPD